MPTEYQCGMQTLDMSMKDEQQKFRRCGLDIMGPVLLIAFVSAFFFFTEWDLRLIEPFFDDTARTFPLNRTFGMRVLYYLAPLFGVGLGLVGLVVLIGSFVAQSWQRFRKEAAFLFLLVLLGPGVFVNGILKEHYGRPRPNQCVEFGGSKPYQPVLAFANHGPEQKFRSFPCGHASIGFVVMGPYFFLRYRNRRRARNFMLAGILLGALAGGARMMEGRHFASDVIWAGVLVYFVGLLLARAFRFYTYEENGAAAP